MSHLKIFHQDAPDSPVLSTGDQARIAAVLSGAGVRFERWSADCLLAKDATQEQILAAYREPVARLMEEDGFQTVDVIHMHADHPSKDELRKKFLSEHTHSEDEVRFFVRGSGMFYLHLEDQVYMVHCTQGDLISVPADTRHWFDMGPDPEFTAIRFFNNPEGWVAHYTGKAIAESFPLQRGRAGIKAILTDVEGTTSSIAFVKETLFPYARTRLADFVAAHGQEDAVKHLLVQSRAEAGMPHVGDGETVRILCSWIDEDRKVTPLKQLQGLIWEAGYRAGDFKAHMYPDAVAGLKRWIGEGFELYVYSSGSVKAQQLFFKHTDHGDCSGWFSGHFDTTSGPKKEAASYLTIAQAMGYTPQQILFLSDCGEELAAAAEAGMHTVMLDRDASRTAPPGTPKAAGFDGIQPGA